MINLWSREARAERYFTRKYGLVLKVSFELPYLTDEAWSVYTTTRFNEILAETRKKFNLPESWELKGKERNDRKSLLRF